MREQLRTFTRCVGPTPAARALGIAKSSLAALLAGLNVTHGTLALVRENLPALQALCLPRQTGRE